MKTATAVQPVKNFKQLHQDMRKENSEFLPDSIDIDRDDVRAEGIVLEDCDKEFRGTSTNPTYTVEIDGVDVSFKLAKGEPEDASQYTLVTGSLKNDIKDAEGNPTVRKGYKVYRAIAA